MNTTVNTVGNFSISTIHHGLFEDVSKSILSSMLGSLNFRAIAYGRMHLRADALENGQRSKESVGYKRITGDVLNIDDRNDADAAIAEAKQREEAAPDFGFNKQMLPGELAATMMQMRDFFAERVHAIGIKSQRDLPPAIADSIEYQLNRALLEDQTRDTNDLRANAGKVITYLDKFIGSNTDEAQVESIFDALPAQVQYKIIAKVINAYEKQAKFQLVKLTRGNMDAATNYKLLKARREEAVLWLTTFSKAKHVELEEYMSRGGDLPEFSDTIVSSNDTQRTPVSNVMIGRANDATSAASARMKEDADAREDAAVQARINAAVLAEASPNMPKSTGPARRAPKPETAQ
jgi:hypothetical protein